MERLDEIIYSFAEETDEPEVGKEVVIRANKFLELIAAIKKELRIEN